METDNIRLQCITTSRPSNLEEVSVRMSCFNFGRKKAQPISFDKKVGDSQDDPTQWRESISTGAAQTDRKDCRAPQISGDASPRNWGIKAGKQTDQPDFVEACDPGQAHTSDDEGTQAESLSENGNLGMHDSTSSLKEGLHAKVKQGSAIESKPHNETLNEEDEEELYLQPEWEMNPHDIFFCSRSNGKLCRLGKGAFGTVYKGVWKEETVAVKVCRQQHITVKAMKQFQKEVAILYGCSHENVVQFKGACCWKGGKRTVLVTEFMEKGDLCSALGRAPNKFSWSGLGRRIALDVARGLAFLHAANIVHFDLKSANILLDQNCRAKLADVGLAKNLTHYHGSDHLSTFMATGDLGTFAWAAPEVLLGFACDSKADIFSFGVLLWELTTTEMPQGRCLRPIRVPEEAPQSVADLIMDCLRHDAAARPSAEELVVLITNIQ